MNEKIISAFGTWQSPITSSVVTANSVSLDELRLHPTGTYWLERRPDEQGRCVIIKHSSGSNRDLISPPYSARSRVHEYGGGVYCITNSSVYFVTDNDQNIYFCTPDAAPVAVTRSSDCCYADLQFDAQRQRLICVQQQDHPGADEPENSLISIDLHTHVISSLHSGHGRYR
jgi:hypothetical protein